MTGFAAEWLAVREAADWQARSPEVLAAAGRWADRLATRGGTLRVLDLGAGTGGNLRCLSPHLPGRQAWTLVDDDPRLLALARLPPPRGCIVPMRNRDGLEVRHVVRDLASAGSLADIVAGVHLITASALFDLVSEAWCRRLIHEVASPYAALLAALTYDGRIALHPEDAFDPDMRALFNRHQRRDKGFGPALGPTAATMLARLAAATGARVVVGRSDWRLGRGEEALLQALLGGWATAAREMQPEQAAAIEAWASRRLDQSSAGSLRVFVGHLDVLAIWPGKPGC